MKRLIVVCTLMLMAAALLGVTHIPGGDVNGVWTQDDSPYYIYGDICVPDGQTLFINPGTEIRFSGNYYFEVQGRVVAMGTQQDSVLFTGPETAGWHGLRFLNTPTTNDSSLFSYCRFENGRAIYAGQNNSCCGGIFNIEEFHKIRISHSSFYNNVAGSLGGSIFSYLWSVKVTDCVFDNCVGSSGGGAIYGSFSSVYFADNIVKGCSTSYGYGGGISLSYGDVELKRNTIVNNNADSNGGGVYIQHVPSGEVSGNRMFNNTATYYGGGLFLFNSDVFCASNLICNNTATTGGGFMQSITI